MADELKIGDYVWFVDLHNLGAHETDKRFEYAKVVSAQVYLLPDNALPSIYRSKDAFIVEICKKGFYGKRRHLYRDEIFVNMEEAYKGAIKKQKGLVKEGKKILAFRIEHLQRLRDRDE